MYIVIGGGGEIGSQLARALGPNHDVVVLDNKPETRERLEALDIQVLTGSITDPDALLEARVDRADMFVAATNWDEVNLLACMLARGLGSKETLCFVGKQSFMDILTDPRAVDLLGNRIDRVLWPQRSLAKEIVEVILVPGAMDAETLMAGRLRFVEYRVDERSPYSRRELGLLDWTDEVFLAGVLRQGEFVSNRDPDFAAMVLEPDDRICFMATPVGFTELQACFAPRGRVRRVMIVGGGNVGYMVAKDLLEKRLEVVLIEQDEERCNWLADELPTALILQGDGTDTGLLESESLARTDVMVAVTDNDEKNLLVSLFAKQAGVPKVITRVGHPEKRKLFEQVGVDIPLTPKLAAVREVVDWVAADNVDHLSLIEESLELLEVAIPDQFRERPLLGCQLPPGATVAALERGKKVYLPSASLTVKPSDRLLVLTARGNADRVLGFLRH